MANNSVKLWIPKGRLSVVSSALPKGSLTNIVNVLEGSLKTAELQDGYLNNLKLKNVLVKLGYFRGDPDDWTAITGMFGYIFPSKGEKHARHINHSIYYKGLRFTTYSEIDVHYHLGTHTVAETLGNDRIEVQTPDRWDNLDDFVESCLDTYDTLGLKRTERENHLLFYATPKFLKQVAAYTACVA